MTQQLYLMQQPRLAATGYIIEKSAQEEEASFLGALSHGREIDISPTIKDLERYAPHWSSLVPFDNTDMCTAFAHLLGQKYSFPQQKVPGIRTAIGLDREVVQNAYQQHYKQPLESIFVEKISARESLRWRWSSLAQRLEALPPFWTAFALTIT